MSRLGLGLGLRNRLLDGEQNPADWPDLKFWYKFDEGAGSVVNNYADGALGGTLSFFGPGSSEWAVPGAFLSSEFGGLERVAQSTSPITSSAAGSVVGTKSVIIVLDVEADNPAASRYLFNYGRMSTTVAKGISVQWRSTGIIAVGCIGETGSSGHHAFAGSTASGGRRHLVLIWDRQSTSIGQWHLWVNGDRTGISPATLAADPGSIILDGGGYDRVAIATRANTTVPDVPMTAIHRLAQMWTMTALPADLDALAAAFYNEPDRLPAVLKAA